MNQPPWHYIACGFNLSAHPIEKIITLCSQAGFKGLEGAPPLFQHQTEAELVTLGKAFENAGVPIETFHIPFTHTEDIASFYETYRQKSVDQVIGWMERAAALGAKIVIQHPCVRGFSLTVESFDMYFQQLDRSLQVLLPKAKSLGLTIAIENMLPDSVGEPRFGSHPEHFLRFQQAWQEEHLGFCLDTGHAFVSAPLDTEPNEITTAMFESMQPRLIAFHLADNAGDRDSHICPGFGTLDFKAIFKKMAAMGFSSGACIEAPPFERGPVHSDEAWIRMMQHIHTLTEQAFMDE